MKKEMKKTIGILVGSLRKDSYSKKVANIVISLAPAEFEFKIISLNTLPIYNQEFDEPDAIPTSYTEFKNELKKVDGYIFITPEYNGSVPALLRNAVDIATRPYGQNLWTGKPTSVISISPVIYGGRNANQQLQLSFSYMKVPVMTEPEMYLGNIYEAFDENGILKDKATKALIEEGVTAYVDWFNIHHHSKSNAE